MVEIIGFQDAIADSASCGKRHLLLGNGFSIGCRADIFHYDSLFDEADFTDFPELKDVFEALETHDFEKAIRALEQAEKIVRKIKPTARTLARRMAEQAEAIKSILVATIASNHPGTPNEISDIEFWRCRDFLRYFLGPENGGYVFTLNYDLLLYWALMHEDNPFDESPRVELNTNDAFGNDEDDPEADYVVWQGETAAHTAHVHYLHGALHLFDSGAELKKYTWVRRGDPLIDQTREAINQDKYPLFVAEGTSEQKKDKIRHNAYLYQSFKVLTKNANERRHCFFIFGHSLAENDGHILKRLAKGRFQKLYVGIFGDPNNEANRNIIQRARGLAEARHQRYGLEVIFYDAASANVWR